jgi:hypothetical protein
MLILNAHKNPIPKVFKSRTPDINAKIRKRLKIALANKNLKIEKGLFQNPGMYIEMVYLNGL